MTETTKLDEERARRDAEIHREVSLDVIRSTPAFAVRTPKGQKDPGHLRWDPKGANEEISAQNIHHLAKNEDNIGIHLFGEMVDVDVDTDNEYMTLALDYFMPHTAHIWGRASRPRTHRLYQVSTMGNMFDPGSYNFLSYIASLEPCKLEARGGRRENARYSLMPGSLHPSGEYYEWDDIKEARSSPVIVPDHSFVRAIRLSCAAAIMAPFWTEGIRNTLCMALSGFMWKAVTYSEELNDSAWQALTKDDAEDLIRGIASITGDDPEDLPSRLRTLQQTWDKAEAGGQVRGANSIAELTNDEKMVRHLYALLTDAKGLVEFEEFAKNFAFWTGESKVINMPMLNKDGASPIMSTTAFHDSYAYRTIELPGSSGPKKMTNMFINSNQILRVDGFRFAPGEEDLITDANGTWINRWAGFAIPPIDKYDKKKVLPFLTYLHEIIADKDKTCYEWILAWLADLFQHPESKPGTALVLVGLPGTGKSFLGHMIIQKIIGRHHTASLNSVSHLVGNFNQDSAYKLFIQCDEALNSRQREVANRLKAKITDEMQRVEPKGVNAFYVEDHSRMMFTSNEMDDSVAIVDGEADRRYAVFMVSSKYASMMGLVSPEEAARYWDSMVEWASDTENLAHLHRYFLDHDYDRALIRKPPSTLARTRTQQSSMKGFDDWLLKLVAMENPFDSFANAKMHWSFTIQLDENRNESIVESLEEWPNYVSSTALQLSYDQYRRKKGSVAGIPDLNEQQLLLKFKENGLLPPDELKCIRKRVVETEYVDGEIIEKKRRVRAYEFPTREQIEEYLRVKYGYTPHQYKTMTYNSGEKKHANKRVDF